MTGLAFGGTFIFSELIFAFIGSLLLFIEDINFSNFDLTKKYKYLMIAFFRSFNTFGAKFEFVFKALLFAILFDTLMLGFLSTGAGKLFWTLNVSFYYLN